MTTGERMKKRRKELGLSADDVAKELHVSRSTVFRYEKGDIEKVPLDFLTPLTKVLRTTPAYLMGWEDNNITPVKTCKSVKIPIYQEVAAGEPIFTNANILDYVEIPKEWAENADYFALQIRGESMEPKIHDKDIVICKKQSDVENGKIVIAKINDGYICKRLKKYNDMLNFISLNSNYENIIITKEDCQKGTEVEIIGIVVESRTKL